MAKKSKDQALNFLAGRLTIQQAAKTLKVSSRRVTALIYDQRLPAVQLGRMWFIKPSDLDKVRVRKPGRPRTKSRTRRTLV